MTRFGNVEIEAPKAPPTPEEIAAIEAAAGLPLPPELLEFLGAANGGRLDYSFDLPTEAGAFPLCFYTVYSTRRPVPGRTPVALILSELESERRLKGVRPDLLPIAGDGGTSVLYVDLAPERRGRIVAGVEGLPGWDGTPEGCLVDVAASLPEFLSGLYLNTVDDPRRGG